MSLKLIVKKIQLRKDKFITRDELKSYSHALNLTYSAVISYLLANSYLVRIFRGIFYIKSIEERKLKKIDMDFYTILRRALEIKGIKNWYFGLGTALKLNKKTHEYFVVDYLLNDKISRPRLLNIMGHKVKFIKLNQKLFGFGIIKTPTFYSDVEKTLLDRVYLSQYKGLSREEILAQIKELKPCCSKLKIKRYIHYYPKTVKRVVGSD